MNNQYSGEEKRKFKRVKVRFTVIFEVNAPLSVRMDFGYKEVSAIALDLSEGGIAVLANRDIPKSTKVTIKFIVLDEAAIRNEEGGKSIEVQGEVRYCFLMEEMAYRVGICFINLSGEDQIFIADFIRLIAERKFL